MTEYEKLQTIAAGSCNGIGCSSSGCPIYDWKMKTADAHCVDWEYSSENLNPAARAKAREMLAERGAGNTIDASLPEPTLAYLRYDRIDFGNTITITNITTTPETLVEKRRATRRRLLGL